MRRWSALLLALCLLTGCTAAPAVDLGVVQGTPPPAAAPPAEESCYYTVDTVTWEDSA